MARRNMHGAGSGFQIDIVGRNDRNVAIQKRVMNVHAVQPRAGDARKLVRG